MTEYLTAVLKDKGIELKVEFNAWHESVRKAELGQVDGLLTATQKEAPSLLFTKSRTTDYHVCFITKAESKWLYRGPESLNDVVLGSIKGYGYGEAVDQYIDNPKHGPRMKILEDGGIERLHELLLNQDIDAFLEDSLVVLWLLKNSSTKVKLAGCLTRNPFYIAINPNVHWANEFINMMDETLKENINLQVLNSIKQDYR